MPYRRGLGYGRVGAVGAASALAGCRTRPARSRARWSDGQEELVEKNTLHDTYWGRCQCPRHRQARLNRLGGSHPRWLPIGWGHGAAILWTRSSLMLNIIGLDHLGLKVTDMDRSLHFYQHVL